MRPLALINGMLLGSLGAIFLSLGVVVLIFMLLAAENPFLREELPTLWANTAGFGALAAISAIAFVGQLKLSPWRWFAEAALFMGLLGMAFYFLA